MQTISKGYSRYQLFSAIRRAGRIARVDLADATGISQSTMTTITAELIRDGLIEETLPDGVERDLRRGRPRVDLKVRGGAHVVAGIKLSDRTLSIILADFENTTIREKTFSIPQSKLGAEALAHLLKRSVEDLAAEAGLSMGDVSGIGFGLPGIVDEPRGFVHWSPLLSERNVDLRDIVEKVTGKPVFVDNDANLVAIAEQYYGYGKAARDFLVVTIEHGVGMGIVMNNELYRGTRGCGAEFGHTKVQLDGALCRCGQRGCLEAYVGDYALLREASISIAMDAGLSNMEQLQELISKAREGEPVAKSILDRAGRIFAMGLANLVNIFDPQLIIISGNRMEFDYLVAEDVLAGIRNSIINVDAPPPEIIIHKWEDLMWAKGAAAYAIDRVASRVLGERGDNAA